mmetsp:Transcript_8076/g.19166  ORF Transcript_8076/g.19166 Transcript_8076/m.19166 type:complete len:208 (-) Transcript_8076:544-1167(-)
MCEAAGRSTANKVASAIRPLTWCPVSLLSIKGSTIDLNTVRVSILSLSDRSLSAIKLNADAIADLNESTSDTCVRPKPASMHSLNGCESRSAFTVVPSRRLWSHKRPKHVKAALCRASLSMTSKHCARNSRPVLSSMLPIMPSNFTAQIQLPPRDELSLGNIFRRNRPISTTPVIPTSSTIHRRAASADFLTGKGLFTSNTCVSSCG